MIKAGLALDLPGPWGTVLRGFWPCLNLISRTIKLIG